MGAVACGHAASTTLLIPLIKPDGLVSGMRLWDWFRRKANDAPPT